MNEKNRILLGITGGIAAYKAIELAGMLIKQGFEVKTILTENALEFVTELNFKAITHNTAHSSFFKDDDPIPHITLADWADLVVVAPVTANVLAKAANGIADDLLSATLLAHQKPVLYVPAMNSHMYAHPATQSNLKTLQDRGNYILEPEIGMLACGYEGKGKFPPVIEIVYAIITYLNHKRDLTGKKILITAGGTSEAIDPMRQITNHSSGKTGLALARAAALRGAEVYLVYGHVSEIIPYYLKETESVVSAEEMKTSAEKVFSQMDIVIMAAAVADYQPEFSSLHKIKKQLELTLKLKQTTDILSALSKKKKPKQKLIGFAAETENLIKNAKAKLEAKKLDLIAANLLDVCGKDNTEITLITHKKSRVIKTDKFTAAHLILDEIKTL